MVDDLSSFSESENDEIITDDLSDISDVAVEIETLKKGKKNSNLFDRRLTDLNMFWLNQYYFSCTHKKS